MEKGTVSILGFQFEPEFENEEEIEEPESYKEAEDEELNCSDRQQENIRDWCSCENCDVMPSRKECVCCLEIDEIKYFKLEGM